MKTIDRHGVVHWARYTKYPWCQTAYYGRHDNPCEEVHDRRTPITCLVCLSIAPASVY